MPFQQAIIQASQNLGIGSVKLETLTLKNLRKTSWTLPQFVDWFMNCHIHFIIAHPHQGTESFGWKIDNIYSELNRLRHHVGFPSMEQWGCPIFTQDKWNYIKALPAEMKMPTFKIPLSSSMDMDATRALIGRYYMYMFNIIV